METSCKRLPNLQIEIFFIISVDEFKRYLDNAVLVLGENFNIEGFRKGKAPREILEKNLPEGKILEEAIDSAIKESYVQKVKELAESGEKIEVIGRPEIEVMKVAKGSPLEFKARVSILPDIVLPDYKKIASKIKSKEISVEEREIEESLKFLQKSRSKIVPKEKGELCQKGDFVEVTFSSPQVESGKETKDNFIMGEGRFIPGFEENILGMAVGEEKEFKATFPEKYFKEDLSGKEADFKVKINNLSKVELPELNDELVKNFGNFENLEALKKSIREGLKLEKEEAEKQRNRAETLEKIESATPFEIPNILVEGEKERMLEELRIHLQNQFKISFSDYLIRIKKTEKEIIDSFSGEALKRVKNFLILREIAKKENIVVSDQEVEEKVNEFLKRNPDVGKIEKEVDSERIKEYHKEVVTNEKIFQLLEQTNNLQL